MKWNLQKHSISITYRKPMWADTLSSYSQEVNIAWINFPYLHAFKKNSLAF